MKNLKFLILALGITLTQGVMAVTLPSTSYNPYDDGSYYSSESVAGSGLTINGHFSALGDGDDAYNKCREEDPQSPAECTTCCMGYYTESQVEEYTQCINGCTHGPSLPLSTPIWFALLLPLLGGVLEPLLRRKQS